MNIDLQNRITDGCTKLKSLETRQTQDILVLIFRVKLIRILIL